MESEIIIKNIVCHTNKPANRLFLKGDPISYQYSQQQIKASDGYSLFPRTFIMNYPIGWIMGSLLNQQTGSEYFSLMEGRHPASCIFPWIKCLHSYKVQQEVTSIHLVS